MKKVLGAIAITAAMFATTAAAGENRADEQRAELAKLWGKDSAVTASQTAATRKNFTGISSLLRHETTAALATTSAFATSLGPEQERELQRLRDADRSGQGQKAARGDFFSRIFGGINFRLIDPGTVEVSSNYGQNLRSETR